MTRVTRSTVDRSCAVCERTLLMGERATRFSPNGGGDYVDVCPLCAEAAVEYGWVREGAPTSPTVPTERRRRGGGLLANLLGNRPKTVEETIASEPILRRLSEQGQARGGGARGEGADPAAPVRAGAGDGRGGRRLQRLAVPPHDRWDRQVARAAAHLDRRVVGGERRGRRHRGVGHLVVPVPRLPGLGQPGSARGAGSRP